MPLVNASHYQGAFGTYTLEFAPVPGAHEKSQVVSLALVLNLSINYFDLFSAYFFLKAVLNEYSATAIKEININSNKTIPRLGTL